VEAGKRDGGGICCALLITWALFKKSVQIIRAEKLVLGV
jgi:hypothetical protein